MNVCNPILADIKHSDWLKVVTQLGTANQIALFQHSVVMLLLNLFVTSTPSLMMLFFVGCLCAAQTRQKNNLSPGASIWNST